MTPGAAAGLEQRPTGANPFIDDDARTADRLALARGLSVRLHRFFSRSDGRTLFVAEERPRSGRRVRAHHARRRCPLPYGEAKQI